jgi:hypothetical protein
LLAFLDLGDVECEARCEIAGWSTYSPKYHLAPRYAQWPPKSRPTCWQPW